MRRVDGRTGVDHDGGGRRLEGPSGDGGPATAAGLVEPNGVALDRDGRTLFIADVAGHRVRSVDLPTGRIATFAGTGKRRHEGDGGPASKAAIGGARAVDVGPDGSVYILEREGNTLRVVRPDTGTIATIAGTGRQRLLRGRRPGGVGDLQRAQGAGRGRGRQCLDRRHRESCDPRRRRRHAPHPDGRRERPARAVTATAGRRPAPGSTGPHGVAVGPDGTFVR